MTCPTCQGSGEVHTRGADPQTQEDYVCPDCEGMGTVDLGPFERHVLPNGIELFYRDDRHEYYRAARLDGEQWKGVGRLAAVSTVIKCFDSGGDGLLYWASRLNNVGVVELAMDGLDLVDGDPESLYNCLGWLRSGEAIDEALQGAGLTWRHIRDRAATRGTNVHREALQALAEGRTVDYSQLTLEEAGYAKGVEAFWREHEPEPRHAERVVADLELGVAGRFDLMVRRWPQGGTGSLVDAKTKALVPRKSERPYYPVKDQVQLAAYDYLAGRSGYPRTVEQYVLYVDAEGDYELVRSHACHQDFQLAMRVYLAAGEIRAARTGKGRQLELL